MSEIKKLGLWSWLTKHVKPKKEPFVTHIGMPRMKQEVNADGLVVNKVEYVLDYSVSPDVRVSDYAIQNLLASGITPSMVGNPSEDRLRVADNAITVVESSNKKS